MSYRRAQMHRPDATASTTIDAMRKAGYVVEAIGRPVDVLVTHPSWPANIWRLIELKSPQGKAEKLKLRTDQEAQQTFCTLHGVPYLLNGEEAIRWLIANRPPWRAAV